MDNTTKHTLGNTPFADDFLMLFRDCVLDLGAPAQTLGAVRWLEKELKGKPLFKSVEQIAQKAYLQPRATERHLRKLVENGYIEKRPHPKLRQARIYRTIGRYRVSNIGKYSVLPRWAARMLPTWGERCLFAYLNSLEILWTRNNGGEKDFLSDDSCRRSHPLRLLSKKTGVSKNSIVDAKLRLTQRGVIFVDCVALEGTDWMARQAGDCIFLNPDFIIPEEFRTKASENGNGE